LSESVAPLRAAPTKPGPFPFGRLNAKAHIPFDSPVA
jgi:hypothetical protein